MKKIFLFLLLSLGAFVCSGQSFLKWFPTTGTDTYATSITNLGSSYNNAVVFIKFGNANSGASTINITVNGTALGAVALRKWDGNSWEALASGDIDTQTIYRLSYNNGANYFELSDAGRPTFGSDGDIPYTNVTSNGFSYGIFKASRSLLTSRFGTSNSGDAFFLTNGFQTVGISESSGNEIVLALVNGFRFAVTDDATSGTLRAGTEGMDFNILGADGGTTTNSGKSINITAGNAYVVSGNGDGGDLNFTAGTAHGSGTPGSINFTGKVTAPFLLDQNTSSTAGGTITLDLNGQVQRTFVGSASFATSKTLAFSNASSALVFNFSYTVTNVAATIICPATFKMSDTNFNSGTDTWTPPLTGQYEMGGTWDGTSWLVKIAGPFN